MIKYVIMNDEGVFQYGLNKGFGTDIEEARVFNYKSSASNSLSYVTPWYKRRVNDAPKGLKVRKIKVSYELVEE